jgi:hypothetical protein
MLLENNGKASSGRRTRHIDIRYFFVTDRIKMKQMRVEYCPTGDMIADFFTKPLQGSLFRKFRAFIMNIRSAGTSPSKYFKPEGTEAQECVGTDVTQRQSVNRDASAPLMTQVEGISESHDNDTWQVIGPRRRRA